MKHIVCYWTCAVYASLHVKLSYFYCCVLIASYVVYKSSSQKPAKIGDFTESLKPPLVTGLHIDFSLMLIMNWFL